MATGLIAWATLIGTFLLPATKFAWQLSVSSVDQWGTPGSGTAQLLDYTMEESFGKANGFVYEVFGCFLKWWYPKMDGFIFGNPTKMGDLGVPSF